MVSSRNRATVFAGCLIAALMVAAACGGSGDDQVAILTEDRPPPPVTEPAEEMMEAESPAPPSASTETAPAPAAEPAAPPPESLPETTEAPPEPAPPPPPAAVEGPLDGPAAAAVVAALGESQQSVTSTRVQVYLSMQLGIDGVSAGSLSNVPFVLYTTSGDRTHVQVDQSALVALSGFEDGMPTAAPANLPPLELILDGAARQAYVKLAPLAALGPGEQPPELQDLVQQGADLSNLWGRSVLDESVDEILPVAVVGEWPTLGEFLALLQAASAGGSIVEARGDGLGEVAGVATQAYTFVIDLGALSTDLPPFLAGFLGGPDAGGPPPEDFLGALPPLPSELTVHIDAGGFVRQVQLDLDLGTILMAIFAGFAEMGEVPEGAEIGLPEFEYLLSMRFETLAVNDPSLSVPLPDPSRVVDVPFL